MARINEQDIELLRERADLVEIVSGYTQLKKAGPHTFKGLCPFHGEKTPSFSVDSAKSLYHCFGCGEGGNVYHFIEKQENLPFPEAVEWVARRVGYELHYEDQRPGDLHSGAKRRLIEANDVASRFFHDTLMRSPDALEARRYLEGRGFGPEVAKRWLLGYAPGRNSVCKHLLDKGFTQDEIVSADLGRISERDGSLYDTFRQRIVFPTWSLQDDVVAFGARALGDQQPKYLNTKETPVFSKSRMMFGLNRAKSAVARGVALVVEGYTDVIALHEAGLTEAVATNGTALGQSHFELLKKFTSRVVLMFDSDEAGRGAAEKGWGREEIPLAVKVGIEVLVAPLPAGRDPADIVREDGAEAIREYVEAAQPLLEFKLDQTISRLPIDTIEAKIDAVRRAVEVLGWHPDPIARHEYVFVAADRIGVDPETVQRALTERPGPRRDVGGETGAVTRERRLPGHVKVEREALRLLLTETSDTRAWLAEIDDGDFTSPVRRELFCRAAEYAERELSPDAGFAAELSPEARTLFTELAVSASDSAPDMGVRDRAHEVFVRLKVLSLERDIKGRRKYLQELNPLEEAERHDSLFTELVHLEARRRDLLRSLDQGAA